MGMAIQKRKNLLRNLSDGMLATRSLQREHDPVHACRVRLRAGVAGSNREAAQIGAADRVGCLVGESFGVKACIGENGVASCQVADGTRSELVGPSHGA